MVNTLTAFILGVIVGLVVGYGLLILIINFLLLGGAGSP